VDEPSTVEPMLIVSLVVVVLVIVACARMDAFQPWLARVVDDVALQLGVF
jgi:hypothetical protein